MSPAVRHSFTRFALLFVALVAARTTFAAEINLSEARLKQHAEYLASDELEGRGVGTKGIDKAADYIAKQFEEMGLNTKVFDGSPFQNFTMSSGAKIGEKNAVALIGPSGKETELKLGEDFNPLGLGGSGEIDLPIVFVGYSITAKDEESGLDYDDFAGIDVKGKAVLMIRKEPQQDNPHSAFDGTRPSRHATFEKKVSNAYQHGAAAVIIVNDTGESKREVDRRTRQIEQAEKVIAEVKAEIEKNPDKQPTEEQAKRLTTLEEALAGAKARLEVARDLLMPFGTGGSDSGGRTFPVITTRRAVLDGVVKSALGKDLATIEKEIDKDLKPQSAELEGYKLKGTVSVERTSHVVKNVAAILPGAGPLNDEFIVIGAHYDHLGFGGSGSLARGSQEIHNGADDNGSGTVTLIEAAQQLAAAYAATGSAPRRSILFIAFTGEERGLIGSNYYGGKPAIDMKQTVAMLNMDMVGRLNENKLIIQGIDTAKEFSGLIDKLNEDYKFDITRQKGGSGPSDHTSFYTRGVPVMHFFTGLHSDYHRPTDDVDKLNLEGMRMIGEMVARTALELAAAEKRPEFVQVAEGGGNVPSGGGDRPYLGSIPDIGAEGPGYKLSGVSKDGPAEKAGIKAGDAIIKFGDYKIDNLEDIDGALRKYKGGDKVKVVVAREGKEVEVEVELGEPR